MNTHWLKPHVMTDTLTAAQAETRPIDDIEHCLLACAGYIGGVSLLDKTGILRLIRETRERHIPAQAAIERLTRANVDLAREKHKVEAEVERLRTLLSKRTEEFDCEYLEFDKMRSTYRKVEAERDALRSLIVGAANTMHYVAGKVSKWPQVDEYAAMLYDALDKLCASIKPTVEKGQSDGQSRTP
jgi:hypothetical protein